MEDALIRYIHFLGIILLSSALITEHLLFTPTLDRMQIKKLVIIDAIYGISALTVLIAGFILVFGVGKPAILYSTNHFFHIKLTLFVIMALLSILPSVYIFRNRKTSGPITPPKFLIHIIRIELTILILIPFCAVFMAKGISFN